MRSDAANLLNRLGQNVVKYEKFRDSFADIEPWPLFEALIQDARIAGEPAEVEDKVDTVSAGPPRPVEVKFLRPVAVEAPPAQPAGLFKRYEDALSARRNVSEGGARRDNVRSILRQLGEGVATGRLKCR